MNGMGWVGWHVVGRVFRKCIQSGTASVITFDTSRTSWIIWPGCRMSRLKMVPPRIFTIIKMAKMVRMARMVSLLIDQTDQECQEI